MVWFRVDDGFAKSRKVLSIARARRAAAVGVWTLAGVWAAGETDGFIPTYALQDVAPGAEKYAKDLVTAGLWDRVEGGYIFHDWADYQPSKAEVRREREDSAARQKAYRDRKRAERNGQRDAPVTHNALRDDDVTATVPRPDPTRPDPTVVPTELQNNLLRRLCRAPPEPPDYLPTGNRTPDLIRWVSDNCPGIDGRIQTLKFRNYWISKSGKDATKLDWDRTYQNWMIDSAERIPKTGTTGGQSTGTQRALAAVNAARQVAESRTQQTQIGAS